MQGDGDVNLLKPTPSSDEPAVEMLNRTSAHRKVKAHLLLDRNFAPDAIGTGALDREGRRVIRYHPPDIGNTVPIEETVEADVFEGEPALERAGDQDGTGTATEAACLEVAQGAQTGPASACRIRLSR